MDYGRYDIKSRMGHYELFKNGGFIGSYDTVVEAAQAIDEDMQESEQESA